MVRKTIVTVVFDYVHIYRYNQKRTLPKMDFEWDKNKNEVTIAKHGLDLMDGSTLFDGRHIYSYPSIYSDEKRYVTVGLLSEKLVALIWTERGTVIRLISLRRARDAEKRIYHARFT